MDKPDGDAFQTTFVSTRLVLDGRGGGDELHAGEQSLTTTVPVGQGQVGVTFTTSVISGGRARVDVELIVRHEPPRRLEHEATAPEATPARSSSRSAAPTRSSAAPQRQAPAAESAASARSSAAPQHQAPAAKLAAPARSSGAESPATPFRSGSVSSGFSSIYGRSSNSINSRSSSSNSSHSSSSTSACSSESNVSTMTYDSDGRKHSETYRGGARQIGWKDILGFVRKQSSDFDTTDIVITNMAGDKMVPFVIHR